VSALEFIAAVAWPVTVLIVAVMFRAPLTDALRAAGGRVKAGPFELEWKRSVSTNEADLGLPPSISEGKIGGAAGKLDELAEQAPAAAIVEAYGRVEEALRALLSDQGQEPDAHWGPLSLARMAEQQGKISPETAKAIEGLDVLRNLAAHGRVEELSSERAHEFVALAQGVLYSISTGA
jgi:hypothetical protein